MKALVVAVLGILLLGVSNASAEKVTSGGAMAGTSSSLGRTIERSTSWVAIATSPNGSVYKVGPLSVDTTAKIRAQTECEEDTAQRCKVVVVPEQWDVTVVRCYRGGLGTNAYLTGSQMGLAEWQAKENARADGYDPDDCRPVYNY